MTIGDSCRESAKQPSTGSSWFSTWWRGEGGGWLWRKPAVLQATSLGRFPATPSNLCKYRHLGKAPELLQGWCSVSQMLGLCISPGHFWSLEIWEPEQSHWEDDVVSHLCFCRATQDLLTIHLYREPLANKSTRAGDFRATHRRGAVWLALALCVHPS